MNDLDKAYIAGLFDSRGDIGIYRYRASKNGNHYLRFILRIRSQDKATLERIAKLAGAGSISYNKKATMKKPFYVLTITNSTAEVFVRKIQPFLKAKAEKIKFLLSQRHNGRANESLDDSAASAPDAPEHQTDPQG